MVQLPLSHKEQEKIDALSSPYIGEFQMAHCLIAVAGAAAGAAYLDAKLHISKDLNSLSRAKKGEENFARAGKMP